MSGHILPFAGLHSPVFLVNSRFCHFSATSNSPALFTLTVGGSPYPEVTGLICRVPSPGLSQAPWASRPIHLCRFTVRARSRLPWGVFLAPACTARIRAEALLRSGVSGIRPGDLPPGHPTLLPPRPSVAVYCSMRRPVGRTPRGRPGNLDPVSIGYASRPRLRTRLTLGGRTCPRNP